MNKPVSKFQKQLLSVRAPDGRMFMLVCLDDGRLGIMCDEAVVTDMVFDESEMDRCVETLLRLSETKLPSCGDNVPT